MSSFHICLPGCSHLAGLMLFCPASTACLAVQVAQSTISPQSATCQSSSGSHLCHLVGLSLLFPASAACLTVQAALPTIRLQSTTRQSVTHQPLSDSHLSAYMALVAISFPGFGTSLGPSDKPAFTTTDALACSQSPEAMADCWQV